jgi:hypothetical protein
MKRMRMCHLFMLTKCSLSIEEHNNQSPKLFSNTSINKREYFFLIVIFHHTANRDSETSDGFALS